jgi:hypothetical protein
MVVWRRRLMTMMMKLDMLVEGRVMMKVLLQGQLGTLWGS